MCVRAARTPAFTMCARGLDSCIRVRAQGRGRAGRLPPGPFCLHPCRWFSRPQHSVLRNFDDLA